MNGTAEQWAALGSALTGIATVALAIIAGLGLRQWHAQLVGTTKHNITRQLVLISFQLRSAAQLALSHFTQIVQFHEKEKEKLPIPPIDLKAIKDSAYLRVLGSDREQVMKQIEDMRKVSSAFQQVAWEFQIISGKEIQSDIDKIVNIVSRFEAYISGYFDVKVREIFNENRDDSITSERVAQLAHEMEARLNSLVDEMNQHLRRYL